MKKKTLALSGHRVTLEAGPPFALKLNINSELHTREESSLRPVS